MYKIKNIGKTKTFIYNGTTPPKKNDIEWSIDYDNNNGVDLNVNMNNNGDKSHYHQYLTNSELEELLKMPVVDKSIHQRLLEDFNPYNNTNTNTNSNTSFINNDLDLITYPRENKQTYEAYGPYDQITPYSYPQSYKTNNDLMNFNQVPMFFQRHSEFTPKSRPKFIKIKIYTKKQKNHKHHKHHSNRNHSKSNRRSSNQSKRRSSSSSSTRTRSRSRSRTSTRRIR
jgi:hypothetical protein